MASLEIVDCLYNGDYLKVKCSIKVPNIKKTEFWKNKSGVILTEEKTIKPPGSTTYIKYCYKLKWDRQNNIEVLKSDNDLCRLNVHHPNEITDDFVSEFEDSHRIKNRTFQPRNTLIDDLRKWNTFSIICKDKKFEINKAILQARSDVFAAMVDSNFKEGKENFVEITDCEPEIVEKMIEFLETDNVKVTDGVECDLYKIAHKYNIKSFIIFCQDLIKYSLTFENASERFKLAMTFSDENLKKFMSSWIEPNFQHICKADNIFTEFSAEEIINIFRKEQPPPPN